MGVYDSIEHVYQWNWKKKKTYDSFRLNDDVGELIIVLNPDGETPNTTWYITSQFKSKRKERNYIFRYLPISDEMEVDTEEKRVRDYDRIPIQIKEKTRLVIDEMVEEINEKINSEKSIDNNQTDMDYWE